eukprot:TRINITY_DN9170_c0_g2_i1.p1 TRINITY_DN9170_c0_g2~~TRINITY_DN9170_c0_g2_i1.p1  ORF type:complete len:1624 (+),score=547.66 TRINITY_DN9170_c0_g2_i1:349-4872(+)
MLSERIVRVESGLGDSQEPLPLETSEPCDMSSAGFDKLNNPAEVPHGHGELPGDVLCAPGQELQLSVPEELLLRQDAGSTCLTWFYDEQLLEQVAAPGSLLRRLYFEVRQLSEGVNRLRLRLHQCECCVDAKGEVLEQKFEVDCLPGKAYVFSVRACAEVEGLAAPVYSPFSEFVSYGDASLILEAAQGLDELSLGSLPPVPYQEEKEVVSRMQEEEFSRQEAAERARDEEIRRKEDELRRIAEEEEAMRKEEARRQAEEEMEARRKVEEEVRRKVEDELRLKREEEEARIKLEEEQRKRMEEDVRRAEEERRREEERQQAEELETLRQEEARKAEERRAEEARRKAEEAEEARRAEAKRQAWEEEIAQRQAAEEAKAIEEKAAMQKRMEEELQRRLDEERRKLQEELEKEKSAREAEVLRLREEAARHAVLAAQEQASREAAQLAAQEAQRQAEEVRRAHAEEEKLRAQEEQRLLEMTRRQMEEELQRRVEEERKALAEETAAAEKARLAIQEERRRAAEEEQRLRQEQEEMKLRLQAEEEMRRQTLQAQEELQRRREELQSRLQARQEEEEERRRALQAQEQEMQRLRDEEEERQQKLQAQKEEWRRKLEEEELARAQRLAAEEERRLRLQAEQEDWRKQMQEEEEKRQQQLAQAAAKQEERQRALEEAMRQASAEQEKVRQQLEQLQQEREMEQEQSQRRLQEEEKLQQAVLDLRRREDTLKRREEEEEERRARLAKESLQRAEEEEQARRKLEELRAREARRSEVVCAEAAEAEDEGLQRLIEAKMAENLEAEACRRAQEVQARIDEEERRCQEELESQQEAERLPEERALPPPSRQPGESLLPKAEPASVPPSGPASGSFMDAFSKYVQEKAAAPATLEPRGSALQEGQRDLKYRISEEPGHREALEISATRSQSAAGSACTTTVSSPSHAAYTDASTKKLQETFQLQPEDTPLSVSTLSVHPPVRGAYTPSQCEQTRPELPAPVLAAAHMQAAPMQPAPEAVPMEANGPSSGNPMDKWMSKILAEKGAPNIHVTEEPKRAEPQLAPSVVLKGSRGDASPKENYRQTVQGSAQQSPRLERDWQSYPREAQTRSPDVMGPKALAPAAPQADSLGPTVTQLPARGHKALPKSLPSASDTLGPTVMQLPSRCPQRQPREASRPDVTRHLSEACFGSMRVPISDMTRAVERDPRAGACRAAPVSDMTRAAVGNGRPDTKSFVAQGSDGSIINMAACRQGVPGAKRLPGSGTASGAVSGAVSPTGSGGVPLGGMAAPQRTASYGGPPGPPGGGTCAAGPGLRRHAQHAAQAAGAPPRPPSYMPPHAAARATAATPNGRAPPQYMQQPTSGLEVSQRMARANDLQRQLQGSPSMPAAPYIGAPSLLDWANKAAEQHFDGDAMGLGLNTLHQLPPPPRSAPAAEAPPADSRSCRSGSAPGQQHVLTVLTSDSRWETLNFSKSLSLEQQARSFLSSKGLKEAFCSGLVSKMKSMVASGQAQSSVDIVDLI